MCRNALAAVGCPESTKCGAMRHETHCIVQYLVFGMHAFYLFVKQGSMQVFDPPLGARNSEPMRCMCYHSPCVAPFLLCPLLLENQYLVSGFWAVWEVCCCVSLWRGYQQFFCHSLMRISVVGSAFARLEFGGGRVWRRKLQTRPRLHGFRAAWTAMQYVAMCPPCDTPAPASFS